jgi:hypothetical protein
MNKSKKINTLSGLLILIGGLFAIGGIFLSWYDLHGIITLTGWDLIRSAYNADVMSLFFEDYNRWMPLIALMVGVSITISGVMLTIMPAKTGGLNAMVCGAILLIVVVIFAIGISSGTVGIGAWICAAAGVVLLVAGALKIKKVV